MKHSDTNYEKEIKVDNIFIAADKHDEQMKASESDIKGAQLNGYFDQEVTDEMLPDWMKDKEEMYDTKPEDWAGDEYPEDPMKNSTTFQAEILHHKQYESGSQQIMANVYLEILNHGKI